MTVDLDTIAPQADYLCNCAWHGIGEGKTPLMWFLFISIKASFATPDVVLLRSACMANT